MKQYRLLTKVVAFFVAALMFTTPIVFAQTSNSRLQITLNVGETISTDEIKTYIENKYNITLTKEDQVNVYWQEGEELFDGQVATSEGEAFVVVKIKDINEKGNCRTYKECITIKVNKPVTHIPYINGYEDGTFRPNQGITREEFATMIGRLMLGGTKPLYNNPYSDVSDQRYSSQYIGFVTEEGIMDATSDGTFKPMEEVTSEVFNETINRIKTYYNMTDTRIGEIEGKVSRVESVLILNDVFDRICDDVEIHNMYSDIYEGSYGYEDILYASIPHTHQ